MTGMLDTLLHHYEQGLISRRDLLATLGTAIAGTTAHSQPAAALGPVRQLNHVSIFVPDVAKSAKFYQDLFALPVLTRQDPGVNLDCGAGFLGIYPAPSGEAASINHLCFGLERFDADATLKTLTDRGVRARIRQRGDTNELYLTDPDGVSVQLQDSSYLGGTGPLGNQNPR